MRYFLIFIVLVLSCESEPTEIDPKKTDDLIESSVFIDIEDVFSPAIKNILTTKQDRIFISIVDNQYSPTHIRKRIYIDADHFIGGPEVFIDFGQNFRLGEILINRKRNSDPIDYTFKYHYDSDSLTATFNSMFNFNLPAILKSSGSSKRFSEINEQLNIDRRIQFINVDLDEVIDKNEDLILVFNRPLKANLSAIGFYYQVNETDIKYITLSVNESGNIIKMKKEFIQKFIDNVNLTNFSCYLWAAETTQIPTWVKSVYINDKSNLFGTEYSTPVIVNFIQSIRINF